MKDKPKKIICFGNPMAHDFFIDKFINKDNREWEVKTNPWLNKNQVVIIDKPMTMGKTETIISKSIQCGMTSAMDLFLQCETIEDVKDYMNSLEKRLKQ